MFNCTAHTVCDEWGPHGVKPDKRLTHPAHGETPRIWWRWTCWTPSVRTRWTRHRWRDRRWSCAARRSALSSTPPSWCWRRVAHATSGTSDLSPGLPGRDGGRVQVTRLMLLFDYTIWKWTCRWFLLEKLCICDTVSKWSRGTEDNRNVFSFAGI